MISSQGSKPLSSPPGRRRTVWLRWARTGREQRAAAAPAMAPTNERLLITLRLPGIVKSTALHRDDVSNGGLHTKWLEAPVRDRAPQPLERPHPIPLQPPS